MKIVFFSDALVLKCFIMCNIRDSELSFVFG